MTVTIGRRELLAALGGAAATWPLAARAQQGERVRRIGVFMCLAADAPAAQRRLLAFAQALAQSGWTDGRNVRIDIRWGAADPERIRRYAAELDASAICRASHSAVGRRVISSHNRCRTARPSCRKAGKVRIFILVRASSGESRIMAQTPQPIRSAPHR
jgi:hypothetical protein